MDEARSLFRHVYGGAELSDAIFAASAEGIYIRDTTGCTYIDCASGTFDQPLGHNHPAVVKAIQQQAASLSYVANPLASELSVQLAAKLVSISPPNLNRVHLRDLTGSTAVEGAVKIAQIATGRRDVITLFGSHHGQTAWTTNFSGNAFRQELAPIHAAGVVHVPAPYCYRCFYKMKFPECALYCLDAIRDFIEYASSGSIACVLVEPVMGNGGNIVPPRNYFRKLRELCDEYGMLLIFDEVQTGIGRLGYFFAAEYFEVNPHILVIGKGLGGPVPRAAILVEERLEKMPRFQHSFSGASTLISTAAALATLDILGAPGFLENVRRTGDVLGRGLRILAEEFPFVGDVRGLGLMWGMEIVTPDGGADVARCNRIIETGREALLILRSSRYGRGNVVKIRPPLIITDAEIDELLRRLRQALKAAA
jgi:4-aminobutyrate aminotransferase-like enzyme